jgi:hypothetical protein
MLRPPRRLVQRYAIPREVLHACFGPGSAHQERIKRISSRVLGLLLESNL